MLNSGIIDTSSNKESGNFRLKVSKMKESFMPKDEGGKKSFSLAEAYELEKRNAEKFREQSQKKQMKLKYLYKKLNTLGKIEGTQDMMSDEVQQIDTKIKLLQQSLQFKKSDQMNKLKLKVIKFLELINFEISSDDIDKITDEIEIILFLIDIFEQKFKEMSMQRKELDDLMVKVEQENTYAEQIHRIQHQNKLFSETVQRLTEEVEELKRDQGFKFAGNKTQLLLQIEKRSLENNEMKKRLEQLEGQIEDSIERIKILETDLSRSKKQENRWKQRYITMQNQKDERIKLLEQSIFKIK